MAHTMWEIQCQTREDPLDVYFPNALRTDRVSTPGLSLCVHFLPWAAFLTPVAWSKSWCLNQGCRCRWSTCRRRSRQTCRVSCRLATSYDMHVLMVSKLSKFKEWKYKYLPRNLRLRPDQGRCVENVQIIEPLIAIMTAMKIYFVTIHCCGVVVSAGRDGSEGLRVTPT